MGPRLVFPLKRDAWRPFAQRSEIPGSGKSLFISALKALKGHRINKDLVGRWGDTGEISAEVMLEEEDHVLKQRCEERSISLEDGNRLILKRVYGRKTGAYVNDSPVSVALFGELLGDHIEIGSQFENRELFRKEYRLAVLDTFIKNENELEKYRDIYFNMKKIEKDIAELEILDDRGKREYLEYQINEIDKLDIRRNEYSELSDKISFIENRSKIVALGEELVLVLESACENVEKAADLSDDLSKLTDLKDIAERLNSASIELADIRRGFSIPDHDLEDADPEELRKRYDRLSSMLMKHSCSDSSELLEKLEKMQFELEDLNEVPQKISHFKDELAKINSELLKKAEVLRKKRLEGAPELEKRIGGYLRKFGMEGVDLEVDVEKTASPGENGIDDVMFRMDTTGSSKHSDISTLSGGELSRFLLAVKLIDKERGRLLLFDEIDSSIGGETAKNASKEMKKNSKYNQVVVVTHFPQTAASADEHLVVEKKVVDGKVCAMIRKLNENEKTRELARMMGDSSSGMFNDSASQMLREG